MKKMTVEDVNVRNRRVLMRVDFNVPVNNGMVTNDKRIRAAMDTIRYLVGKGAKLILMSHLGRPKGQRNPAMSLKPCVQVLSGYLKKSVAFVDDCIGEVVHHAVERLLPGDALLLENLRFYAQETDNDPGFAQALASLGDIYVNDAFGTAHRAHASTEGVTHHLQPAVAGYLMQKEIEYLDGALLSPATPFVAILGGAKISGKIDVIQQLLPRVDRLIIGGGMAYTFLHAQGYSVGRSLLEVEKIELAKELLAAAAGKILLPVDCMASTTFDLSQGTAGDLNAVRNDAIAPEAAGLDIGPETIEAFQSALQDAKTIVWNGPMGVFEIDAAAKGTFAIAQLLARLTDAGAVSIIGGGDSAAAAEKAGVANRISHISTGGGASLEFLEGKTLPGLAALSDRS
jgi:phosphoglycerate kinase